MLKNITTIIIAATLICTASCATMTPVQVHETLPKLTKTKLITQSQAEEASEKNECKYLTKERTYTAQIGLTAKDDLKYAVKGIDEWVILDGGNSYVLKNFNWVAIGTEGASQLNIEFHTLLCK